MKPSFGSAYLDDYISIYHNTLYSFHVINRGYDINRGHYLKRVFINIRASKNISGLVKVSVTSPAGHMKFLLMLSPGLEREGWQVRYFMHKSHCENCCLDLRHLI